MMTTMSLPTTDEALIPALRAHDESAVATLLDRYWARSYHVARQLTGDPATAEDVAQETFLRVLRNADRFDTSRPFRPWFWKILETTAREHHRRATRRRKHESRVETAKQESANVEQREEAVLVREHLGKLSEKYRTALTLRYLEGLSLEEVGEVLGCSEGTVSSRVRRGLEALRASLAPALGVSVAALAVTLPKLALVEAAPASPTASSLVARARVPEAPSAGTASSVIVRSVRALGGSTRIATAAFVALALGVGTFVAWPRTDHDAQVAARDPRPNPPASVAGSPASASAPISTTSAPVPTSQAPRGQIAAVPSTAAKGTRSVRGRVTLAGAPYSLPTVCLLRNGETSQPIDPKKLNPNRRDASVDREGTFAFDQLDPKAEFWVLEVIVSDPYNDRRHRRDVPLQFTIGSSTEAQAELRLAAEGASELDVRLVPVTVSGEVVDRTTKEPIAGARVHACSQLGRADSLGRFRLTVGRSEKGDGCVVADAPGYALAIAQLKDGSSERTGLRLLLGPGVTLHGRVVGEDGAPVADAEVSISDRMVLQGVEAPAGFDNFVLFYTLPRGATTRADGTFEFEWLQPSPERGAGTAVIEGLSAYDPLSRRHAELSKVVVGAEPLEIKLVSRRGWKGTVVSGDGVPVPHARVVILGKAKPGPNRFGFTFKDGRQALGDQFLPIDDLNDDEIEQGAVSTWEGMLDTHTNARGRFDFEKLLTAGRQNVLVTAQGFAEKVVEVDPASTDTITIERAVPVRGRVVVGGKPLANALVYAYPAGTFDALSRTKVIVERPRGLELAQATPSLALGWDRGPPAIGAAVTDDEGRYEIDHLAAGTYDVAGPFQPMAQAFVHSGVLERIDAKAGVVAGGPSCDLEVSGAATSSVSFRAVANDTGEELAPTVHVHTSDAEIVAPAPPPDASGLRTVSVPSGSDVRVELAAPGRLSQAFSVTSASTDLGVVRLVRGGAHVELRVSLPEKPFGAVELYCVDPQTGLSHCVAAPATGAIATIGLDALGSGTCELRAFVRRGTFPEETLGEAPPVNFDVHDGVRVEVDLRDR
jgi:RNA polymerase sigma-70 factor (ECF subfamily)